MLVEADISGDWDRGIDWSGLAERSVRSAIAHSRRPDLLERDMEVSIKFTDDAEVQALNAEWRGKDRPTNVLSFPMVEEADLGRENERLLGDVVLAHGVCAAEAAARRIGLERHAAHLVVHGTLHLLGYDHETTDADAEDMEGAERRALQALGIADPYEITEVHT